MASVEKKGAQSVGVAVDPFDHLARRTLIVERHVQQQTVPRQIGANPVRRRPPDSLAEVVGQQRNELYDQRYGDKQDRGDDEWSHIATSLGPVDEVADNLGIDQLEAYLAEE